MKKLYLIIFIAMFWTTICYGADHYVSKESTCSDQGPGTASKPWCTIQKSASDEGASPGDTVFVKAGNYSEAVVFKKSGNKDDGHIVFRNYEDDVVTLKPGYFYGEHISYIKVIGFHIYPVPSKNIVPILEYDPEKMKDPGHPGIDFSESGSHIEIRNNVVTGANNNEASAIVVGTWDEENQMHDFIIDGNHVHHNYTGRQEGVRVWGWSHDFEITNNTVDHNSNIGIVVVGWLNDSGKPYSGIVSGNISHENALNEECKDIAAGIYLDCPNNIIVEHNISWGNGRGFELGCEPHDDRSKGNVIRYNIAYGNNQSGLQVGGYQGGFVHDSEVYNNVFYNNDGEEIGFDNEPGENIKFFNNILYDPGTLLVGDDTDRHTFQYNCFIGEDTKGSDYITDEPLFINAEDHDFRVKPKSPCVDSGDPDTPEGLDFWQTDVPQDGNGDGEARADIGAYEYKPDNGNNTQPVAQITTPVNGATFIGEDEIAFEGTGSDNEDGELSGTSLMWSSNVDGQIGQNESFTSDALSAGKHQITLTVTDSEGATGTAIVEITVNDSGQNPSGQCITADNLDHIDQGRANFCGRGWFKILACAVGSGDFLGLASPWCSQTSSVQKTDENYWEKVADSCP